LGNYTQTEEQLRQILSGAHLLGKDEAGLEAFEASTFRSILGEE
jgi:hypothetical protein